MYVVILVTKLLLFLSQLHITLQLQVFFFQIPHDVHDSCTCHSEVVNITMLSYHLIISKFLNNMTILLYKPIYNSVIDLMLRRHIFRVGRKKFQEAALADIINLQN